jgi:hypothetical protein
MLHERAYAAQTEIRPPRSDTRINKCVGLIDAAVGAASLRATRRAPALSSVPSWSFRTRDASTAEEITICGDRHPMLGAIALDFNDEFCSRLHPC